MANRFAQLVEDAAQKNGKAVFGQLVEVITAAEFNDEAGQPFIISEGRTSVWMRITENKTKDGKTTIKATMSALYQYVPHQDDKLVVFGTTFAVIEVDAEAVAGVIYAYDITAVK